MLKQFIEWMEGDASRGRKVALMSTTAVFLILTITTFIVAYFGIALQANLITIYITFSGLMGTVFAFYTSTKASTDSPTPAQDDFDKTVVKVLEKLKAVADK